MSLSWIDGYHGTHSRKLGCLWSYSLLGMNHYLEDSAGRRAGSPTMEMCQIQEGVLQAIFGSGVQWDFPAALLKTIASHAENRLCYRWEDECTVALKNNAHDLS